MNNHLISTSITVDNQNQDIMSFAQSTSDTTEPSDEFRLFYQSALERRLAYTLFLRTRGYEVDIKGISQLRAAIREIKGARSNTNFDLLEDSVIELQGIFAFIDGAEKRNREYLKVTLYQQGPIKVRMRPERNHGRPLTAIKSRTTK